MIVSFLIMHGFHQNVTNKIFGFSGHFNITQFSLNNSYQETPLNLNTELYLNHEKYEEIKHVQEYAHKPGLIKTENEILGIVFKGVGKSFDVENFSEYIVDGEFIHFKDESYSNEIMISQVIADKLNIAIGEDVVVHFFQNPPRSRKLFVSGIYETNLSEYYDDKIILGDINLIRRLNNWPDSLAGGMEVFLSKPSEIAMVEELINDIIPMDQYAERVSDKYIQVFEWLNLIRRQVNIFLVIILLVVCVNMISIILILIMERTQMIGTLKALGSDNKLIRRIFSFSGMQLLIRGLIIGNVVGLGVCFLQDYFEIITLNPKDYYMSVVPIGWNWLTVLLLNVLTFITVFLILTLPAALIARVQPIKAIKFN